MCCSYKPGKKKKKINLGDKNSVVWNKKHELTLHHGHFTAKIVTLITHVEWVSI